MFSPTQKELEKLGFVSQEGVMWHRMLLKIPNTHTEIMYFDDENEFVVGIKTCYPDSIEDIKTLIRLFSKK